MNMVKKSFLMVLTLLFILSGCSKSIPLTKTIKTTEKTNGDVVTVEETGAPPAVTKAASDMAIACYASFDKQSQLAPEVLLKMSGEQVSHYFNLKLMSDSLLAATGINPREVCSTPANIYEYAMVHDQELYKTIRGGIEMIENVAPYAMTALIGVKSVDKAGPRVQGDYIRGAQTINTTTTTGVAE